MKHNTQYYFKSFRLPKAELQQDIYPVVGKMVKEIEEEYGTLICSELSNPHGDWEGKARKKNCMSMIIHCAGLAAKYAEENKG